MRGRPRPGRDRGRGTAASARAGRGGVRRLLHPVLHLSCCTHPRQEEQSRLNPCLLSHSVVSFQKTLCTVLPSPTPLYFSLHILCTYVYSMHIAHTLGGPLAIWGGFQITWFTWGSHLPGLPCWEQHNVFSCAVCSRDHFTSPT